MAATLLFCATVIFVTPSHAQTYTILHNFTGGADGANPGAGLTLNGTSNLFGGTWDTVFRLRQTDAGWFFSPIYKFNGTDGEFVSGRVTFGPGGALYGASAFGGIPDCIDGSGCGLIFSMRPPRSICRTSSCPWTETVLYQFDPAVRPLDGYQPQGGLIFDTQGNLYGTTQYGSPSDAGVVFELSPAQGTWTRTVLHAFDGSDGANPNGNLVIDRSGNIIGTTQAGGGTNCPGSGCGVIFELIHTSSGWVYSTLHTFTSSDGAEPSGGLISDAEGNFYGVTGRGGAINDGMVYELSPSNGGYTFQVLHDFSGVDGQYPIGILALDSNNNLYGVTNFGGAFGPGTVFKLTHSGSQWVYSDLHDFAGGQDGAGPNDGPTLDPSGNLYGTTLEGGTGNECSGGCGVIWEITP